METENQETQGSGEPDLLALAMQADANGDVEGTSQAEPTTESPAVESQKAGLEEVSEKNANSDKNTSSEEGPETKQADDKQVEESKYAKARKEEARKDKSWKKLEEEKEKFRLERESFNKEKENVKSTVFRDDHGYSADDYENFAKTSEDPELADRAKEKALSLRKQEKETRENSERENFHKEWKQNLDKLLEEDDELKDESSDLGKAVSRLLKDHQVFSMRPDGILRAYDLAKAQRQAGLVSGLNEEINKLKQENNRLNKLTGISSGGPNKRPASKSFNEMTSKEQEVELERMAAEADRS